MSADERRCRFDFEGVCDTHDDVLALCRTAADALRAQVAALNEEADSLNRWITNRRARAALASPPAAPFEERTGPCIVRVPDPQEGPR